MLSYLGACLALAITAGVVPELRIDGAPALLLAGLLLVVLDSSLAVLLHGLLVRWPIIVAQALGVVAQFGAILFLGRVLPGVSVGDTAAAGWAALLLTLLNSLFAELVAVSDDDSYYSVLVRRLAAREFGRPKGAAPGLLVVQVDGLSLPVLRGAIRAGRVPTLGRLVRSREAALHPWTAMLPPTTPASQAGILHGNNDGIAGFRWFEKATGRLLVANHPEDATEMVRRVSDGRGLLADDGAGIGNLVTGDAPRTYLTMATIYEPAAPDEHRRLRGFYVGTVNYIRLAVLMVGEVGKELYQAEHQRGWSVEPRMHRDLNFAIERAATNIALRTTSTALVIEEMYGGAPIIYVDYTGYDAVSHHCGPERMESIDALEGIDRAIGSLLKAARHTARPYRLVVLSDHGQSLGATFRQRFGASLEAVIAGLLPDAMTVVGTTDAVESTGVGRRVVAELRRGSGLGRRPARHARTTARGGPSPEPGLAHEAPADVVVASSGSLAHVYVTGLPGRATAEAIEARAPGLIDGLRRHPGIGAVIARSAADGPVALARDGRRVLASGLLDGTDPLLPFGPGAGDDIRRLEAFTTSGDLILLGAVDAVTGEVTGLEELIGSHGGLGGWQTDPFILVPAGLELTEGPLVGAPSVYRQLVAWQQGLPEPTGDGEGPSLLRPATIA
ncbi:MAG: alkaline phosphatase family protein [Candidatus Limnocylindrales bacterium]